LEEKPDENRSLGRPVRRWEDNIKMDLKRNEMAGERHRLIHFDSG
jgi:hypothetical protein